ncbi:MAG: hypothetical protein Q4G30_02950 [Actinomycetaceae bacterium]|nr:hypothetical protein [Actinomycetaceae bacterium]
MSRHQNSIGDPDETARDVDARFLEITEQLEDIADPLPGPRDYHLVEDTPEFQPPAPPTVGFFASRRAVVSVTLITVALVGFTIGGLRLLPLPPAIGVLCLGLLATGVGILLLGLPKHRDPDLSNNEIV